MLEIFPVYYSSLTCSQCRYGRSSEGSSQCYYCPPNTYPQQGTRDCILCKVNTMGIPGAASCIPRPQCSAEYDIVPIYQNCMSGKKRFRQYNWRDESFCDKSNFTFSKEVTEISCADCGPGTSLLIGSPTNCGICKEGDYSTETNSIWCKTCPAGSYAPKAAIYTKLETMPDKFETSCEKVADDNLDPCAILKGWIVAKGGFTVLPNFPARVRLILKTKVNVTNEKGRLDFNYKLEETSKNIESLSISIDGETTGIYSSL